ncbi:TPA: hypothetical protein LQO58_002282 [Staphylococcus pseudintermedius]|nr:hypothetical protein [Staphylococcus pseudintermedius]MDE9987677.1 hypothetical protein [Staphylococcus pseudintermedius]HCT0368488.1 hypothetical protein [Staphylococcus pseudintermedius]
MADPKFTLVAIYLTREVEIMTKEKETHDKSYFRKQDDNLYFSIPSNDKQRKTFLGLDGSGFWYLILLLAPIIVISATMVYLNQFQEVAFNSKLTAMLIMFGISYVAIGWTLCSHDSDTGKQKFSVLYQMIKYRTVQPKLIRPKFANRKNTILQIGVENNEYIEKEKGYTISTTDIIRRKQERARATTHSEEEESNTR